MPLLALQLTESGKNFLFACSTLLILLPLFLTFSVKFHCQELHIVYLQMFTLEYFAIVSRFGAAIVLVL